VRCNFIEKGVIKAYDDPGKVTSVLVERCCKLTLRTGNQRALALHLGQETSCADSDRMKTIAIPTWILWGRLYQLIPLSDAERFHLDTAGSQLVVFDGLGHMPQEEDFAQSVKAVEAFLIS
jgi:pimeloyl-ACP methyl ester carboxylesterase